MTSLEKALERLERLAEDILRDKERTFDHAMANAKDEDFMMLRRAIADIRSGGEPDAEAELADSEAALARLADAYIAAQERHKAARAAVLKGKTNG